MSSSRMIVDAINMTGKAVSEDEALYEEVNKVLISLQQLKKTGIIGQEIDQIYLDLARKVQFPSECREFPRFHYDMWSVLEVSRNFHRQKQLVMAAGVSTFLNMIVLRQRSNDLWDRGFVSKVYANGGFTFQTENPPAKTKVLKVDKSFTSIVKIW